MFLSCSWTTASSPPSAVWCAPCIPGRRLAQPVLVPDRPWEGARVYIYGSVCHDPDSGRFRMRYLSRIGRGNAHRSPEMQERQGDLVLYATSEDGVHLEKPSLGRHQFDGSTANNIVMFDKHRRR